MTKKPTLKDLQQQVNELTEALQRERADSDNIRRQHESEIKNLRTNTKINLVSEILPVVDNFERALKHIPNNLEEDNFIKGIQNLVKQFEATLKNMGVQRIPTVGEEFNPDLHEAVSMQEGDGSKEIVCEELQAGYMLNDNVIRHAMVKVSTDKPGGRQ